MITNKVECAASLVGKERKRTRERSAFLYFSLSLSPDLLFSRRSSFVPALFVLPGARRVSVGKTEIETDGGRKRDGREGARTKGKDLNGLSQKAFSYSPWQTTMAKWQEREHILNRFPSSVRDVFMWRAEAARGLYVRRRHYRRRRHRRRFDAPRRGLASFFGGLEFKRFKAISQGGVGASDCRPSNADRPTTILSFPPPRHPQHPCPSLFARALIPSSRFLLRVLR